MWDRGGRDYDAVSFAISDALAHAAQRLNARAGDRILDIATDTGWSAATSRAWVPRSPAWNSRGELTLQVGQ
jgi:hypothetical protein